MGGAGPRAPAVLKGAPGTARRSSVRSAQARECLVSRRRVRAGGSVAAAVASLRHHEQLQQRGARRALHPRVQSLHQ